MRDGSTARGGLLALLLAAATLATGASWAAAEGRPVVVATFSVIEELAQRVAGDDADVRVLVPRGAEVHEWELSPFNLVDLEAADIVLANGYMLEQWMHQIEAAVQGDVPIVRVAEESGHPTIAIRVGDFEGSPDPHLWMDPRAAAAYARVIAERLAALDPASAERYAANAEALGAELEALHAEIDDRLAVLPPEGRLLITSEAAFLYFADAFELEHYGIWGSNAEQEGTPEQLRRIIDIIEERRPAAVFFESTITDRYVWSVAEDTGVRVAGPLYVDSLGEPGSGAETYAGMLRTNAQLLVETLATQ